MKLFTAITFFTSLAFLVIIESPARAEVSIDEFNSMCIIQVNQKRLMETCRIKEMRKGQWRIGLHVVAPIHKYEMRDGVYSQCPSEKPTWDSVSNSCYEVSWRTEPVPGEETKSCPEITGLNTPCPIRVTHNSMMRVTPHLLVQGLTFG